MKGIDKRYNIFISALFWGLFGYLFIPEIMMDITRHYEVFDQLIYISSFSDFFIWTTASKKPDYLMYFICWILGRFGFGKQSLGFVSAFVFYYALYYLALKISDILRKKYHSKNIDPIVFVILPFLALVSLYWFSGIRQCNAIILFLLALICYYDGSRTKLLFFCSLTTLLHFSMWPFVLFLIVAIYLPPRLIYLISFCLLLISPFFIVIVQELSEIFGFIGGFGEIMSGMIDAYIFSLEGDNVLYGGAALRWYMQWAIFFVSIPLWFFANKRFKYLDNEFYKIHYFYLLVLAYMFFSLFGSLQIFTRALDLLKFLFFMYTFYVLVHIPFKNIYKAPLYLFILIITLAGFFSIFVGKEYKTFYPKLVYMNVYQILQTTIDHTLYWRW
ncbi:MULTISPECIES: EpsG family protein [unclassified Parabacteroides]|uniref:EpsG family protein n=1 Tax=unclassified Parabacteroides TaxID=2649774 RepID=UPI002476F712|nr:MULTISPECIES: EpsG family protein [unclassified Parabacteroides]